VTTDAWLTLGIIVALFAALIWDRFPTWVVFVCALAAIITLDLAPESDALSGFSNSGVLSVVVLFVVAEGMYRTGAISMLISRVVGLPPSERAANVRIQPITAAGSAFLNNTPIVAMLIPVIGDLGRSARLQTSRMYMGVSHASVLGGASTLIGTSTNLIIAGLVATTYSVDLGIFFPTLVGVPAAIIGIVFMLLVADRLLGRSGTQAAAVPLPPSAIGLTWPWSRARAWSGSRSRRWASPRRPGRVYCPSPGTVRSLPTRHRPRRWWPATSSPTTPHPPAWATSGPPSAWSRRTRPR
jgi:hypothetical protein